MPHASLSLLPLGVSGKVSPKILMNVVLCLLYIRQRYVLNIVIVTFLAIIIKGGGDFNEIFWIIRF